MEDKKKISAAQQKAVNKYVKENYDRLNIKVPKGHRATVAAAADAAGDAGGKFQAGQAIGKGCCCHLGHKRSRRHPRRKPERIYYPGDH